MLLLSLMFIICIILVYCVSKGVQSSYELLEEIEQEIKKKEYHNLTK